MEEEIMGMMMGGLAIITLFIGLPWLIFHYMTKWKQAKTLTDSDERLLDDMHDAARRLDDRLCDDMHDAARRLDDRLCTIERIMTAENPNWRQQCLPGREQQLLMPEEKSRVR